MNGFTEKKHRSSSAFVHHEEFLRLAGFKFLNELFPPSDVHYKLENYFKFLVVRDPWTRLLSAFRDKFEKNDSLVQITFHNYYGKMIIERYRKNASK